MLCLDQEVPQVPSCIMYREFGTPQSLGMSERVGVTKTDVADALVWPRRLAFFCVAIYM
jgi:hypothetical protein